jgi:FMN phosphatase YigB (HAD superfamily)
VIKLLVTDLDNTVYDWLGAHVPAFNAQVVELSRLTGLPEQELLAAYRRVHQRQHTSEYAYAFLELDVLDELDGGLDPAERLQRYGTALHAYRAEHLRRLRLYPGVRATLGELSARGIKVVAHTDAMMFYASLRICVLGLEPLLDGLFAVRDHDWPAGVSPPFGELFSARERFRSAVAVQEELPRDLVKPDPEVLWRILRRFDVAPAETVYVGDSLSKDVRVAQRAGVHDVYAEHGLAYDSPLYEQLVEVTHWSAADVRRETELRRHPVSPAARISAFPELVDVLEGLNTMHEKEAFGKAHVALPCSTARAGS